MRIDVQSKQVDIEIEIEREREICSTFDELGFLGGLDWWAQGNLGFGGDETDLSSDSPLPPSIRETNKDFFMEGEKMEIVTINKDPRHANNSRRYGGPISKEYGPFEIKSLGRANWSQNHKHSSKLFDCIERMCREDV